MVTPTSYPARVLAGLMSESEFWRFLATYAVPEDRANPPAMMHDLWAASASAMAARPPYEPGELEPWCWGDTGILGERAEVRSLFKYHPDAAWAAVPLERLIAYHPSLDLEQADFWSAQLANPLDVAAPPRNEAPVAWRVSDDGQELEVRSMYALLGAYLAAEASRDSPLPAVRLHWQPGLNVLQVAKLGKRLVLVNGHHRAYAFARAGATKLPCLTYAVDDLDLIGVSAGSSADREVRSEFPPRLVDFLDPAMAVMVQLRRSTRVVSLSINEQTIQER